MSISVSKIVSLPQAAIKLFVQNEIEDESRREYKTIGGVFSNTDYAWLSNGPRLEVVHTKTGSKVGAWTFGWVLKDSYTEVVCVEEIQRPNGRHPLLAVGVDCHFSGGMLCIFDFVTSRVIRAIHVKDKITTLHVIDAGYDVFTLPGPLRNFDGIIAVGTAGGDVFLIDICRQICDEALTVGGLTDIRDELNPCQLNNITSKDIPKIEIHKEFAVRNSQHLAIHINVVFDKSTKHFILKGPKGDDRIHVNKDEVTISALYYCPQLGSLLVGYNFGALQLYNLMNFELVYTSPVCDEHIPISHFAIQEPADDPRAFCYIWAVYSAEEQYSNCLPLAVMYAFCYHTKEYHEGYGFLYQDFNTAAVHYQMELGVPEDHKRVAKPRGGYCLNLNAINKGLVNKEGPHHDSNEDNFAMCVLVWNVWYSNKETDTFLTVFDLNQWYKEQMPNVPNIQHCSTYMIQMPISSLINSATNKSVPVLDVHIDKNSLQQFKGAQRLEEHFCPNSISFGMCCLREIDVINLHNCGVQKALLCQIKSSGPLCLVEPAEVYQEAIGLGLIPIFIDLPVNTPITTNQQREIILGVALENRLIGWLCQCASEWANGSYLSIGCSLDFLINWAFQRAIALKSNCDEFCVPLFDYSEGRLDNNTNILLNSCTSQLKNLCSLYAFMIRKLYMFLSNQELVEEQYKSLQMVSVYFEVLQWLLNVGLLPECPLTAYPRSDDLERINAPYPAEMLIDFYNHRRGLLKILNEENFPSSASVLFIDTLIEKECGGKTLQEQWRNDGGNGLYPPPSLQALLRTYLIENVELSYKHSVIIYVFLDLAMTLDQDRYKPVITHLIKFPAVFKVSPSLIKITQAFWQLDHGDYNTAMGLLLDPLILNDDLNQWHHRVALRSLLLQKQHNFALLYFQVRKPILTDDEDVLTAISLYVANNMLDEAFYFEKHFVSQPNGDKFLFHLFNECEKNDKIRSIIYRCLSPTEENFFLKYLSSSKQSIAKDLHVYYHILRSRYIEAFESHERTVSNQIENQGLVGQENAIFRDKLVYNLKKLLPEISCRLLNLCSKEKNTLWQQVSKPTPLSVFVCNVAENARYKSSIIAAALAKARQTFNDTLSNKFKLETEGTPFLRTPKFATASKRSSAIVITPRIIDANEEDVDSLSPRPAKCLKLSPRLSSAPLAASVPSKLDTPIVKRKTPRARSTLEEKVKVATPHSILKVKSLINDTPKESESRFEDDFKSFEKLDYTSGTSKKSGLGLSPRKSLAKASPMVRFEGLKSSSSSSLNTSRNLSGFTEKLSELSNINVSPENDSKRSSTLSKNTSTDEEIFYSPESSLEEKQETRELKSDELNEKSVNETKEVRDNLEKWSSSSVFSPKARKSYKRSLGSSTPIRSSPRLSKNAAANRVIPVSSPQKVLRNTFSEKLPPTEIAADVSREEKTTPEESISSLGDISKSPPSTLPKLRPRKSLCRRVLETNALNRVLNSPLDSPSSRSKKVEIVKTDESTEIIHLESTLKYADGKETRESNLVKKQNLTESVLESDSDMEDFSLKYGALEGPELSASMLDYLNKTNNKSETKETVEKEVYEDNNIENEREKDLVANQAFEGQSTVAVDPEQNTSAFSDISTDYSVNISYEESGPKLSESMIRCINNRNLPKENLDTSQNDDHGDMEVMDVDVGVDIYKDLDEEIYKNAEQASNKEPTDSNVEETAGKEEIQKEPESNRPVDPEMNVFEVSDDLSFNDGLTVEKEVTLEENDLCYDQQNTLQSVLEENISTATSTSLNALEKNVFTVNSSCSEEELDVDKEFSEDAEDEDQNNQKCIENEVIEIDSSSEENEERSKESSVVDSEHFSQHNESDEEQLNVSHQRNIYDTEEDYSSESSYERHYSEISENSDDMKYESEAGELFHGNLILDVKQEDEQSDDSEEESIETKEVPEIDIEVEVISEDKNTENQTKQLNNELISDENKEEFDLFQGDIAEDQQENEDEHELSQFKDIREKPMEARIFSEYQEEEIKDKEEEEEISQDNDDNKFDQTEMQFGLFQGDIPVADDSKPDEQGNETIAEVETVEETHDSPTKMDEDIEEQSVDEPEQNESEGKIAVDNSDVKETEEILEEDTKKNEETKDVDLEENLPVSDELKEADIRIEIEKLTYGKEMEEQKGDEEEESAENVAKPRTRSSSVSSAVSGKAITRNRHEEAHEEPSTPKRSTRRNKLEIDRVDFPQKCKSDINDLSVSSPVRTIKRSRRMSTEEVTTPTLTLRKRSASVDETKISSKKPSARKEKEVEADTKKERSSRAASVSCLPKITEEDDSVKDVVNRKKSKSVLENYSMNRRVTRQQVQLLKKVQSAAESPIDLEYFDPIVFLDKLPFDGKPDPDENKVYETSPPSSSNSTPSTPKKPSRRLRSASQISESSRRSKSKTPVKAVKGRPRKASIDEASNASAKTNVSRSKRESTETVEAAEQNVIKLEPRITRSRAGSTSMSSVHSEDSNASETTKVGRRRQSVVSQATLPEIKEESNNEKPKVPKKRTRKNSSQK